MSNAYQWVQVKHPTEITVTERSQWEVLHKEADVLLCIYNLTVAAGEFGVRALGLLCSISLGDARLSRAISH